MGSAASTCVPSVAQDTASRPLLLLVCHSADEAALRSLLSLVQKTPDAHVGSRDDGNDRDVVVLTDKSPRDTEARARVLGAAAAALVAVGPELQRSAALLEALSFLKDRRKRVVAGPIAFFARPSGAVGAVCVAYGQWLDQLFASPSVDATADSDAVHAVREELQSKFELLKTAHVSDALEIDRQPMNDAIQQVEFDTAVATVDDKPTLVFISTSKGGDLESGNDAARVVAALSTLESQSLSLEGVAVSVAPSDPLAASLFSIHRAAAVMVVITADLSGPTGDVGVYRTLVEAARRARKPLLPVKESRAGILSTNCWLSLVLAGRLWYEVDARDLQALHTPYAQLPDCPCRVDDSCPATDLLLCANALLLSPWRQRALEGANGDDDDGCSGGADVTKDPREMAELDAAKESAALLGLSSERVTRVVEHVDTLVSTIQDGSRGSGDADEAWRTLRDELGVPVTTTDVSKLLEDDFVRRAGEWPSPVFSSTPAASETVAGSGRIRYQVRRTGFVTLPSVVDERGVFLPGTAPDVLLSCQWGVQHRVLAVHQQGRVSGLRAWLDVFGHMQGNVNAAMARAVEGVACVVVFVTHAYVSSVNCRLEFQYAAHCGKPLLLAFLEDDPRTFALPEWMADAERSSPLDAVDLRESADGRDVDVMDALFGAVRKLAALRGVQDQKWPPVRCDGSLRLFAATAALRHAAIASSDAHGAGGVPCSRCGVLFRASTELSSGDGACRRHSAYYLGGMGGLMAGRWVCCSEPDEDGPGCVPATHMAGERRWTIDTSYGTYTWAPDADQ